MSTAEPLFKSADAFQDDVLALPIKDLEIASSYYTAAFGMHEVSRSNGATPQVVLERDGVRIGFAVNGGDSSQDGAAILVTDAHRAREELAANGIEISNWRVDDRDGLRYQVFFVVAPDGLCYYFHAPVG